MEERIRNVVGDTLREMGAGEVAFVVERPANPDWGDYAVFVGMGKAEEVVENIKREFGDAVSRVDRRSGQKGNRMGKK